MGMEPDSEQSRFVTPRRVGRWLLAGGVVVLPTVIGLTGRRATGLQWLMVAASGAIAIALAVIASRSEFDRRLEAAAATELAVDLEWRLQVALGDAVTPIGNLVGRIAVEHENREALKGQLRQNIVDAAAQLCGPERTRAALFELADAVMRLTAWTGRAEEPREVFARGDPNGDTAHALVAARDYVFVEDVQAPPSDVNIRPEAGYRTFLAVAVYAADKNFGMLTVDAPEPGTLDSGDVDVARALAQLLGAGLAIQ